MPDASTRRIQSESGSRVVLALLVVFPRLFPASYSIRNVTTFSLRSLLKSRPHSGVTSLPIFAKFHRKIPACSSYMIHGSRLDSPLSLVKRRLLQSNSILKTVSRARPTRQGFRNSRIMWGRADKAPEFTPL